MPMVMSYMDKISLFMSQQFRTNSSRPIRLCFCIYCRDIIQN